MIEHAVQDQVHAALLHCLHQRLERRIAAQGRIDREIVVRVVAVVGAPGEDRGEIECVDPQALQVIELLFDALQVAAVELVTEIVEVLAGLARIVNSFVPDGMGHNIRVAIEDRAVGHPVAAIVVARVAVAEAVREDLVNVRIL